MRVFVISLDATKSLETYRTIFPNVERFDAIDTRESFDETKLSVLARYHVRTRVDTDVAHVASKGAIGCFLSHAALWRRCVQMNEPIVVLEEDFVPTERVLDAIRNVPKKCLFASVAYLPVFTRGKRVDSRWCRIEARRFAGSQMYLIKPRGAERLLRDAFPIETHVDVYVSYMADEIDAMFYSKRQFYSLWSFLRDHARSSIGHRPYIKKIVPDNDAFYVAWIVLTLLLLLIVLVGGPLLLAHKHVRGRAPVT